MKLYNDQKDVVASVYESWQDHDNTCAVMPTGGGKTVVFSHIIDDMQVPTCAIAHRKELVGQMAMALARFGVRHRIIGPSDVVKQIVSEQVNELGTSFYNPNAKVAVAGIDTLIRRGSELSSWLPQVKLWVMDECFPAGTLVDGRPIESIKVGDVVTAFNEKHGTHHGRRVLRVFKNPIPSDMIAITAGHHVVQCTQGHPFWTQRGWVDAGNITNKDKLFVVRSSDHANQRRSAVQVAQDRSNILSAQVRSGVQRSPQGASTIAEVTSNPMSHMPTAGRPDWFSTLTMAQNWASVLRQCMRWGVSLKNILKDNESDQSNSRIRQDEDQQPNEQRGYQVEGIENAQGNRTSTKVERRQRQTTDNSRGGVVSDVEGLWFRIADHCQHWLRAGCLRISHALQNRLWKCAGQDGYRSRRVESQQHKTPTSGPEENEVFEWVGVDHVEVYQSTDTHRAGDGFVYNIEVDEFHTYIANGIVVHNCHHLLRENKWGTGANMFPNARGLGVTATPVRADGKGLGRHADGLFDDMVEGLTMRQLIDMGRLTDYKVYAPPSDIDLHRVPITQAGDFSPKPLKTAVRSSHIIGDVVDHYLRIAKNKKGITFCTDVETATDIAKQFRAMGVRAEVISADTPTRIRSEIMRKFRKGDLDNLVNVDLFGEGLDLPGVEVVSMARPTASYGLYCQQFGRALRLLAGKEFAIIIDHVGNVVRHGLPDKARMWSLDGGDKRPRAVKLEDDIPLINCAECTQPYQKTHTHCPWCGHKPVPVSRGAPEFVDGDLYELDAATLAEMRGAVALVDDPSIMVRRMEHGGAPGVAIASFKKNAAARLEAQIALRESIAWWGAHHRAAGKTDAESYKLFYWLFKVDILSAQALGRPDAIQLANKINEHLINVY